MPALVLLVPFLAERTTDEVSWTAADFAVAALILCGAGFLYALATSWTSRTAYRIAVGLPILLAVIAIWGLVVQ